jgi:hypothetical protein
MLNRIDLSRIDLNLLVVLSVVLEECHVGRAAGDGTRRHPPPVMVGRLRGCWARSENAKGVADTARARTGEPVADIPTCVAARWLAVPFDATKSERRFVIGAPDAVMTSVMTPILRCVDTNVPHVDIGLLHLMPEEGHGSEDQPWQGSLEKLERREIDIALLPLRVVPPRFEARRLLEEDFVVAMRKGHRFARSPTLAASAGRTISLYRSAAIRAVSSTSFWRSPTFELRSDRVTATPPRDKPLCPFWPSYR